MSVTAMAQWPNLPYNPDENGDGLIGVVDLAALLAQYNTEFASAVVSEDGEGAIVFIGDMPYPQCDYSCSQLPGHWRMPQLKELVPVWSEVYNSSGPYTWLRGLEEAGSFPMFRGHSTDPSGNYISSSAASFACTQNMRCYCAAKQLPRVEYSHCSNCIGNMYGTPSAGSIAECCNQKVAEGWYPLGGTSPSGASYPCINQSFWRWAE